MTTHGANLQSILTFQLVWWGFVLAAQDNNLNLLLVAGALTAIALILHYRRFGTGPVLKVFFFAGLGFVMDCLMANFSVIQLFNFKGAEAFYFQALNGPGGFQISGTPFWLLGIWLIFILSLQGNQKYFLPSRKWGFPLYVIGGPVTYWLCQRFGLVIFQGVESWIVMMSAWAIQIELWYRFLVVSPKPTK